MRITVVTAVLNRAPVVADCLRSVREQTHPDVEHIVVDGGSQDGTLDVLRERAGPNVRWTSERDAGLYDAVNKGVSRATGDVVGILGADDVYTSPTVLARVADVLGRTGVESCYGDLRYVQDDLRTIVRDWRSSEFRRGRFARGWMPPHPTFFVRRSVYERLGLYDTRLRIAADYELMLRYLEVHGVTTAYLPEVLVLMRVGGVSNRLRMLLKKSAEDCVALWRNGFTLAPAIVAMKNARKLPQLLRRSPP
jgi:glycosyltransferase involved in cell wall biosynthesis